MMDRQEPCKSLTASGLIPSVVTVECKQMFTLSVFLNKQWQWLSSTLILFTVIDNSILHPFFF